MNTWFRDGKQYLKAKCISKYTGRSNIMYSAWYIWKQDLNSLGRLWWFKLKYLSIFFIIKSIVGVISTRIEILMKESWGLSNQQYLLSKRKTTFENLCLIGNHSKCLCKYYFYFRKPCNNLLCRTKYFILKCNKTDFGLLREDLINWLYLLRARNNLCCIPNDDNQQSFFLYCML